MKKAIAAVALLLGTLFVSTAAAVPASAMAAPWCDGGRDAVAVLSHSGSTGYGTTGYPDGAVGHHATWAVWPSRIQRDYPDTEFLVRAYNGAEVTDFGSNGRWSGSRTAVTAIDQLDPNMVIVFLGGNEFMTQRHPAVFAVELMNLMTRVKAAVPTASLLMVSEWDFPNIHEANPTWSLEEYRQVVRSVSLSFSANYVDLSESMPPTWEDANPGGLYLDDEYAPGVSVHPNNSGHIRIYWAVRDRLQNC